jgi:hypothetical protein
MKAATLEIGVLRLYCCGATGKSKEEEGRSQQKCFYKYEMLPTSTMKRAMAELNR